MWPGNNVHADELADPTRGGSACISRRFDCPDVPANKNRDVTGANVFLAKQLHVSRFDHRVSSFDGADKTFRLDHSECFQGHLRQSSLFKIVEVKKQIRLPLKLPPQGARIKRGKTQKHIV
jgi:hypothetical protein